MKNIFQPWFRKGLFCTQHTDRKPYTRIECNLHENLSKPPPPFAKIELLNIWMCGAASCICSVCTFSCLFSNEYKRKLVFHQISSSFCLCRQFFVSPSPKLFANPYTRAISYEKIKLLKEASFLIRIHILIMKYGSSWVWLLINMYLSYTYIYINLLLLMHNINSMQHYQLNKGIKLVFFCITTGFSKIIYSILHSLRRN